ncbi:hypothetical protein Hanom_Chr13g01227771 [Helianthus anomalus]
MAIIISMLIWRMIHILSLTDFGLVVGYLTLATLWRSIRNIKIVEDLKSQAFYRFHRFSTGQTKR